MVMQTTDPGTRDRRQFIAFLAFFFLLLYLGGMWLCKCTKISMAFGLFVSVLTVLNLLGAVFAKREPFKELEIFPREKLIRIAGYGFLLPFAIFVLLVYFNAPALLASLYGVIVYPLAGCAVFQFQLKKNRGGKLHFSDRCLNTACWCIIQLFLTGAAFRLLLSVPF